MLLNIDHSVVVCCMTLVLGNRNTVPPRLTDQADRAYEIQRQMNADALQAKFNHILSPLQDIANDCTIIECTDEKRQLGFPIFSLWSANHVDHTILNGIIGKSCPLCEVSATELGPDQ